MHYHCEIIMPPVDDVEQAVQQVLEPFSENYVEDEEDDRGNPYGFWDWYEIGGRWDGEHVMAGLDKDTLQEFYDWLKSEKITVSSIIAGKEELQPASQAEKVDAKWRDMFPNHPFEKCPLFRHSHADKADVNVMRLGDVSPKLTAARWILAVPGGKLGVEDKTAMGATAMVEGSMWNGVNFVKTASDGTLEGALEFFREEVSRYREELALERTPKEDWLIVTVDYHS